MTDTRGKTGPLTMLHIRRAQYPDLRVCQLIFNALNQKGLARWPSGEPKDIFYIEDDVLANALEEYRP